MGYQRSFASRVILLFVLQFAGYFIVTLNMQAVASTAYLLTFITDILMGFIGFTSIKAIINADTRAEKISYICGGALGAQFALVVFRRL